MSPRVRGPIAFQWRSSARSLRASGATVSLRRIKRLMAKDQIALRGRSRARVPRG